MTCRRPGLLCHFVSGVPSKKMEIARPKSISELPDKLLMSGINLPGEFCPRLVHLPKMVCAIYHVSSRSRNNILNCKTISRYIWLHSYGRTHNHNSVTKRFGGFCKQFINELHHRKFIDFFLHRWELTLTHTTHQQQ